MKIKIIVLLLVLGLLPNENVFSVTGRTNYKDASPWSIETVNNIPKVVVSVLSLSVIVLAAIIAKGK